MSTRGDLRRVMRDPSGWLATGASVGLIAWAPGTFGSLLALLLWLPIIGLSWPLQLAIVGVCVLLSGWSAERAERLSGVHDPGWIVIDEIAGQWLTLFLLTQFNQVADLGGTTLQHLAIGFACFRVFDIFKPWPISWADQNLSGGWGTTWDDVLAAIYAAPCALGVEWVLAALGAKLLG